MSTIARVSVSSDQKNQPDDDDMPTKMLSFLRKIPASGIILSAMSGFCLAAASLIVKKAPNVNSIQILVSRAIVQFIFVIPFIIYYKLPFFGIPGERLPLFMRGFIGFIYASLMYLLPVHPSSGCVYNHFFCSGLCNHHSLHFLERDMRSNSSNWSHYHHNRSITCIKAYIHISC